jgi:hypothetical protein
MCVRVYNKDTKDETDSVVEFAEMLGIGTAQLPVDNNYGQLIPQGCLCQVDIKKACETYGFNYEEREYDNCDVRISKKTPEDKINEVLKHR